MHVSPAATCFTSDQKLSKAFWLVKRFIYLVQRSNRYHVKKYLPCRKAWFDPQTQKAEPHFLSQDLGSFFTRSYIIDNLILKTLLVNMRIHSFLTRYIS